MDMNNSGLHFWIGADENEMELSVTQSTHSLSILTRGAYDLPWPRTGWAGLTHRPVGAEPNEEVGSMLGFRLDESAAIFDHVLHCLTKTARQIIKTLAKDKKTTKIQTKSETAITARKLGNDLHE